MGYSRSVLLAFCLANVCISYAQEPPRFRVLETPAGVRIDALSNNGHLVGNREGYGVFEWWDQNGNLEMDNDEFRYPPRKMVYGDYFYIDVDVDVNGNGVVVYSIGYNAPYDGYVYLWKNDSIETIHTGYIQDLDINIHEQIVGGGRGVAGHTSYLLYATVRIITDWHSIPLIGGYGYDIVQPENEATGINDSGVVVGWSHAGPRERPADDPFYSINFGPKHAFIWEDYNGDQHPDYEEILDLGKSEKLTSPNYAYKINNEGLIVGSMGSSNTRGFTFQDKNHNQAVDEGEIEILPTLNAAMDCYQALSVNNKGIIGGVAWSSENILDKKALIWMEGKPILLNDCVDKADQEQIRSTPSISDQNWILCTVSYESYAIDYHKVLIPVESSYSNFDAFR